MPQSSAVIAPSVRRHCPVHPGLIAPAVQVTRPCVRPSSTGLLPSFSPLTTVKRHGRFRRVERKPRAGLDRSNSVHEIVGRFGRRPDAHRRRTSGQNRLAIAANPYGPDRCVVPHRKVDWLARRGVPVPSRLVPASRRDGLAVRAEGDAMHCILMEHRVSTGRMMPIDVPLECSGIKMIIREKWPRL